MDTNESVGLWKKCTLSKQRIHSDCKIFGTMFTQVFVIGTMDTHGEISIHQDQGSCINSLIHFGDVSVKGGYNVYFDGVSKNNAVRCWLKVELEHEILKVFYNVFYGIE